MTITFANDNNVIVYALEKIISFARINWYIFLAQSVWWTSSIIGLQWGLGSHIHNLRKRIEVHFWEPDQGNTNRQPRYDSSSPRDSRKKSKSCFIIRWTSKSELSDTESSSTERQNNILQQCKEFLRRFRWQRRSALQKAVGKVKASRVNLLLPTKKTNRVQKKKSYKDTAGICTSELQSRKIEGECLRCAWLSDRKESHRVKDCRWPIKLHNVTAEYKGKNSIQKLSSDTE